MNKLLVSVLTSLLLFGFEGLMAQDQSDPDISGPEGSEISVSNGNPIAKKMNKMRIIIDTDDLHKPIGSVGSLHLRLRAHIASFLGDGVNSSVGTGPLAEHLENLTPEQRQRLEDKMGLGEIDGDVNALDFRRRFTTDHETSAGEVLVATVAIVFTLGMPILILSLVLLFAHRRRKQKMELVKTYIDANQTVPEHVLAEFDNPASSHLSSGVKWVGIGLGVALTIAILADNYSLVALGLIPLFIGLGRLVLWKLED